MKYVEIIREYEPKQTKGLVCVYDSPKKEKLLFQCKSLELAWLNNKPQVSCIPAGEYKCTWYKSPRISQKANDKYKLQHGVYPSPLLEVYHYLINYVLGRAGCLFHSVNYSRDLRGCVGLGSLFKDIDLDGQMDIIHSGDTIKAFESLMQKEPFLLKIQ